MAELLKETVVSQNDNINTPVVTPVRIAATSSQTIEYLVYFFFGVLEIFLAFRLILKFAGASIGSGFVSLIYGLTGIFILPFEGIFRRAFTSGIETTSILEPATLVAIVVYAVLAYGIVKLVRIISGEKQQTD